MKVKAALFGGIIMVLFLMGCQQEAVNQEIAFVEHELATLEYPMGEPGRMVTLHVDSEKVGDDLKPVYYVILTNNEEELDRLRVNTYMLFPNMEGDVEWTDIGYDAKNPERLARLTSNGETMMLWLGDFGGLEFEHEVVVYDNKLSLPQ